MKTRKLSTLSCPKCQHVVAFFVSFFINNADSNIVLSSESQARNGVLGIYFNPYDPLSRLVASIWDRFIPEQFPNLSTPPKPVEFPSPSNLQHSTTENLVNIIGAISPAAANVSTPGMFLVNPTTPVSLDVSSGSGIGSENYIISTKKPDTIMEQLKPGHSNNMNAQQHHLSMTNMPIVHQMQTTLPSSQYQLGINPQQQRPTNMQAGTGYAQSQPGVGRPSHNPTQIQPAQTVPEQAVHHSNSPPNQNPYPQQQLNQQAPHGSQTPGHTGQPPNSFASMTEQSPPPQLGNSPNLIQQHGVPQQHPGQGQPNLSNHGFMTSSQHASSSSSFQSQNPPQNINQGQPSQGLGRPLGTQPFYPADPIYKPGNLQYATHAQSFNAAPRQPPQTY